jgi:hypothetical protein
VAGKTAGFSSLATISPIHKPHKYLSAISLLSRQVFFHILSILVVNSVDRDRNQKYIPYDTSGSVTANVETSLDSNLPACNVESTGINVEITGR